MESQLLIYKYQPKTLNDFIGNNNTQIFLNNMITKSPIPFILLGSAESGKTSYLDSFINDYSSYNSVHSQYIAFKINSCKEQGINFFKNEVKLFCQTKELNKKKILAIDNLDQIPETSQHIIRFLIETYCKNILFIASATIIQKVIPSLQSHFITFYIEKPSNDDLLNYYYDISKKENVKITKNQISIIMKSTQKSIRKTISLIEKFKILDQDFSDDEVKEISFDISYVNFEKIIDELQNDNIHKAVMCFLEIINLGYSCIDIYEYFYIYIKNSDLDENIKLNLVPIICKFISNYYLNFENKLDLIFFTNHLYTCLRKN